MRLEALSEQVMAMKVATSHECLILNYGWFALLAANFLPETSQSLLDRSHGGHKLINCNALLIYTRSL